MKRRDDELMLFSGTANLPLAQKVAEYLKRPLNKIDIKHFPDRRFESPPGNHPPPYFMV